MKLLKSLLVLFLISFISIQCTSNKVNSSSYAFTKKIPFKIELASFQKWVGGRPNTGGINVKLYMDHTKDIVFKSLYFRGRKSEFKSYSNEKNRNGIKLIAAFNKEYKNDISLQDDSKKEYGNIKLQIPFKLKNDEAVIAYEENGKLHFYKIKNMEELEPAYYP